MLPTLVLVGRPNVGKSTLFNRLTRSRDALVADLPGLTRDRHYGRGRVGEQPFLVVDTGGLGKKITEEISKRHQIPMQAAEKIRKVEYIELMTAVTIVQTGFRWFFGRDCNPRFLTTMLIPFESIHSHG